jgi:hypothetical protein
VALTAPIPRPQHRVSDVTTAEWRSLATLSLAPILSRVSGEADVRFVVSRHALSLGFTQRRERGARPLFTRPCRSFWSAFAELIRGQTSPTDFCNDNYVRATKPGLFLILAEREASTSFFLLSCSADFLRSREHAASRTPSVRDGPSAGSSRLRRFAQP